MVCIWSYKILPLLFLGFGVVKPKQCNLTKSCGAGHITKELCTQRRCCYNPTNIKNDNCFAWVLPEPPPPLPLVVHSPEIFTEILPSDALEINPSLERQLNKLKDEHASLTKAQAIHIANSLERWLRDKGLEGEGVNWDFNKNGIFNAYVKRDRSTFFEPVKFRSGTVIAVDKKNQIDKLKIGLLVFVEYTTLSTILQGTKEGALQCTANNESIVSVNAYTEEGNDVSISLSFNQPIKKNDRNLTCEYLNETSHHWFSTGCITTASGSDSVTCFCNHTTKFAILFQVTPHSFMIPKFHQNVIQILEYVMEGLSFVCLLVTFLSLILVLRRRSKTVSTSSAKAKERTIVHTNFVAALGSFHMIRLLSEAAYGISSLCGAIVFLSHYFMLASGMWMLIEGIVLYVNLVIKSMKSTRLGWMKFAAGWGIPGLIVLVSSAIGFSNDSYVEKQHDLQCPSGQTRVEISPLRKNTTQEYCWLSISSNMIWSALGPLIFIFAINFFILMHTVSFVLRLSLKTDTMKPASQKSQNFKHLWNTTKGILVLFPILGVPWLIGFLVNLENQTANIAFQYIHVILNGLQGVFIFILYTAVNKEVREIAYRVINNRWQQHKISSSRSANNSTLTPKERFKKSITSIMGTPLHRKKSYNFQRGGSNSHYSFQSNTQHRQSSGSSSVTSTMLRMKSYRKYSTGSIDRSRLAVPPIGQIGPGYSGSLPRGWGYRTTPQVTRTPSIKSLHSDHSGSPKICSICGTSRKTCRHNSGSMTKLNWEASDQVQSYYEFQSTIGRELPTLNSRWHRMTAEEFKRFSAIPEEKRRSGVNSFYLEGNEGMSSTQMAWDKKAKTLERTNLSSHSSSMRQYSIAVDIHSPTHKKEESQLLPSPSIKTKTPETNKKLSETITTNRPLTPKKLKAKSIKTFEIGRSLGKRSGKKGDPNQAKLSMPTPKHSKRKSERMSAYSEKLIKAVEKWKQEEERMKINVVT